MYTRSKKTTESACGKLLQIVYDTAEQRPKLMMPSRIKSYLSSFQKILVE
jgi:hypothetical protein